MDNIELSTYKHNVYKLWLTFGIIVKCSIYKQGKYFNEAVAPYVPFTNKMNIAQDKLFNNLMLRLVLLK